MIVSPGAKINLGLYITGKREDGFHNLLTLFYPIPFSDSLEIIEVPGSDSGSDLTKVLQKWGDKMAPPVARPARSAGPISPGLPVQYSASGIPVNGPLADNLCVKAYQLLQADFPELPAIHMHLHKSVPMGAGLGGGSADGASTLKVLDQLANLQLSEEALLVYAEKLGSDCPFFIKKGAQLATGKGEKLSPVSHSLSGYTLVLVCPPIHVPSAKAFSQVRPQAGPSAATILQLIQSGPENWKQELKNQFEESVFSQFPVIQQIKAHLYELGATYASMTGSGSSVFGIFKTGHQPAQEILATTEFPDAYTSVWALQ